MQCQLLRFLIVNNVENYIDFSLYFHIMGYFVCIPDILILN